MPPPTIPAQTVILVRHAEKAAVGGADPALSPAGLVRAKALADALAGAGVTHVITSQFQRTRQTAQPTAQAAGVVPQVIDNQPTAAVLAAVNAAGEGATVLVVGHTNTVPGVALALGDPSPPLIDEPTFDVMVVIHRGGPHPRTVHARYGAPS